MKTKIANSEFEETFSSLKRIGERFASAKTTFELLKELNPETTTAQTHILVSELNKIQFSSNTNTVFYFYFPIVSHILYYKPEYEKDLLRYLIGPNFANGTSEVDEMIAMIKGAMEFKLKENEFYLTNESQFWVENELPKLEKEIQREIDLCWKELEE
ncbi:hypothetical protein [Flavobacterium piscisymbiosum]|uniref:Uncharacterized protein n=1 Tax=Flavobacterium piscisymbiosum TaxID=2893753 RepID=A0ABS8M9V4_9FLAO|nr:hypothetical protein [Flavobacterium sp. F-30]MCC9062297.1 hypothetical protein [Flavobacterium sp. F-30]